MNATKTQSKPLSILSLYTGAGGLDLGFEAAGFSTRVAVENDAFARDTLKKNRPSWSLPSDGNALELSSRDVLNCAELGAEEVDAIVGGPPCQPFSKFRVLGRRHDQKAG